MPAIITKDYEWRQTNSSIIINVNLFGNPSKIDFLISDKYVKASYSPHLLELFLWGSINEDESECTLTQKEAIISLKKKDTNLLWPTLELSDLDKELRREYRNKALEYSQLAAERRAKAKSEKREELQRQAVRAQIDLDTLNLNKIERIRDTCRKEAMKEFEDWRLNAEKPIFQGIVGKKQNNRKAYRAPLKWFKEASNKESSSEKRTDVNGKPQNPELLFKDEEVQIEESFTEKITETVKDGFDHKTEINNDEDSLTENIFVKSATKRENETEEDSEDSDFEDKNDFENSRSGCLIKELDEKDLEKFCKKKKKELETEQELRNRTQDVMQRFLKRRSTKMNEIFNDPSKSLPLPRKSCTISVTFSERAFPTPARESCHLQEQEWLEKQAEARRQTGFVSEDLRPEERNPQWLKDKGDDFFKEKNYLGSINAYTHGIKLSDKMASLYVNRSAAHYALGNFYKCAEDCSTALELMVPKCEGNRESRVRCHARRGAALCKLSAPQHGIPELEAALKLAPDNESIKLDLVAAKKYFKLEN